IAIVADLGTLQRLPGIVGRGHMAELAFTGKDIDAERAAAIGLVNQVAPDADGAYKAAAELAAEIASNSPLVVQGVKAVLRAGEGRSVAEGLDYVGVWNAAFVRSNDIVEAMAAFVAKRPPQGAAVVGDGQPVGARHDGSGVAGTGVRTDGAVSGWPGRQVRLAAAVDGATGYQMNVNAEHDSSPIIDLPWPPGTYFDALPVRF